tara:strand:- start:75 stop:572 length:498 start_codon:yes stop_codon:yes gene_type:complete
MAFKMKGPSLYKNLSVNRNGYKNASDGKSKSAPFQNYENPQDYKVFNMGNKPTPIKQTDKDLKDYLLDEKGFNQADADRMIKDGAYTISDKGFLAWYKGKDEPAEPKGGKEDVMEEGRTPMNLTSAKKAENLARWAEKYKDDPEYWKKVKEVTGADKAKYKGKQY